MANDTTDIDTALAELRARFLPLLDAAETEQTLRDENAKVLGKKGELTKIMSLLGKAPPQDRKAMGEKINVAKQELEGAFQKALAKLKKQEREAELSALPYDLTLPGRVPVAEGHKHPIAIVREEVVAVFRQLGFAVHDGPEVELEENNFTLLGFPPDHPATDMQDSFWTKDRQILRTHTSNIQIRAMKSVKPPMAFEAWANVMSSNRVPGYAASNNPRYSGMAPRRRMAARVGRGIDRRGTGPDSRRRSVVLTRHACRTTVESPGSAVDGDRASGWNRGRGI